MPLFLAAMRSISASDCGCLPDCQFTDFFYSVSTNKFMWEATVSSSLIALIRLAILWSQKYYLCILFHSVFFQGVWLTQPQHRSPLHSRWWSTAQTLVGWGWLSSKNLPWYRLQQGHSISLLVQVTKKYEESYDSLPSYISNLASPMRKRHQDKLIATKAGKFSMKVMLPHVEMMNRVMMALLRPLGWSGWFQPIQCLGGGYRCGQHILWKGDCHG